MSSPKNILDSKNSYTSYFVIEAFEKTEDAEKAAENISLDHGPEGEQFNGGIVIVNDSIQKGKAPSRYLVKDFRFNFVWTGNHIDTTIGGGGLIITDTSGGEFLTFFKERVIGKLKTSLENITFVLIVFWNDSEAKDDTTTPIIKSEPLFFSISQIEHKMSGNQHFYDCDIIPLYNTKAQYTTYNRVYGMNITHADGNLHEEIPKPEPSGGSIKPRGAEDGEKNDPRKNRITKSKPMETLGDAFTALEKELNESIKIHQAQFQEWQKVIRDDYVEKLKPPEQKKELPIKYVINLQSGYDGYNIDNRNLPFEQPEQRQKEIGVRTIPTQHGETLDDVIDRIMEYSKKVGEEARNIPAKDYKVCKVWRRRPGGILYYNIVIKQYVVPFTPENSGINTGPGEGGVAPITFYFKGNEDDFDVLMFDGILHRSNALRVVENVDDTEKAKLAFGAEREAITAEREVSTPFFKTGYSGNRIKTANTKVLGVEYPRELSDTIKRKYPIQNVQQSAINITITGNPFLMSDLFRQPTETAVGEHPKAQHYKRPEVLPMYAKILVQHEPLGETGDVAFYHKEWMHIYQIENIITNGTFFQRLTLLRTDNLV